MKNMTLRRLLDGSYICEYAFPGEYDFLTSDNNETFANEWLSAIDMRLARVADDGAFFMAPKALSNDDRARIRDEFLQYRDRIGPALRLLQVIRNANDEFSLNPGENIQHADLVQKVNDTSSLADQLRSLVGVIRETEVRYTNAELLRKLLEHLRKEGYLIVVDPATELYRSTGKVQQLTQFLRFLGENASFAKQDQDESDATDGADDLFDSNGPV